MERSVFRSCSPGLWRTQGHPSLGLSSAAQELSVEGFPPPGLQAARWGGSVAGSSGQPAKQQEAQLGETALGAGPGGEGTREQGWEGWGWGDGSSGLAPLGAGSTASSAPTVGPGCTGYVKQGMVSGDWLKGDYMWRSVQEVP